MTVETVSVVAATAAAALKKARRETRLDGVAVIASRRAVDGFRDRFTVRVSDREEAA